MKLRRYGKDISLIFFVLLTLFLTTQVWFSSTGEVQSGKWKEYLLKPVRQIFQQDKSSAFSQNIRELLRPQKIVLHHNNRRAVLYADRDDYEEIYTLSLALLEKSMSGEIAVKSKETVSAEDYYAVLKNSSVYLDYHNLYDFRIFSAAICGSEKSAFGGDLSVVRECVIGLGDNVLNQVALYLKDYKSENVYRYILETDKADFVSEADHYFLTHSEESTLTYSFELNFHKRESGSSSLSRMTFDPLILFHLVPAEVDVLAPNNDRIENWFDAEYGQMTDVLKAFRINPMTMRKYTDLANAKVFVENDVTLTINPEGFLEYSCVEGSSGIEIAEQRDRNNFDIYNAVLSAVGFVYELNEELPCGISGLRFDSDLIERGAQGSYQFHFDLYADGFPVLQTNPQTGEPCHFITMRVENGYLKEYRQFIRSYKKTNETDSVAPVINAVDGLVDRLDSAEAYLSIASVGKCYLDGNGKDPIKPQWDITIRDMDGIFIVK